MGGTVRALGEAPRSRGGRIGSRVAAGKGSRPAGANPRPSLTVDTAASRAKGGGLLRARTKGTSRLSCTLANPWGPLPLHRLLPRTSDPRAQHRPGLPGPAFPSRRLSPDGPTRPPSPAPWSLRDPRPPRRLERLHCALASRRPHFRRPAGASGLPFPTSLADAHDPLVPGFGTLRWGGGRPLLRCGGGALSEARVLAAARPGRAWRWLSCVTVTASSATCTGVDRFCGAAKPCAGEGRGRHSGRRALRERRLPEGEGRGAC